MSWHSRRYALLTRVGISVLIAILLYQLLPRDAKVYLLSQATSASCSPRQIHSGYSCKTDGKKAEIPNIVNSVYILSDPVDGTFPLQFSHYLSLYAAWYRWQPDIIYLHTNVEANSSAVRRAQSGEAGKWAQRFFEIPGLVINTMQVPTHAGNGKEITGMEHKSDFVRVRAVHDFGGVYIDMDVHPLRDIKPLREAGFEAVSGKQLDGYINSGTFLSAKGGRMVKLWLEAMNQVYDGGWTTHSNGALTEVGQRLAKEPCKMLTLESAAFAPVGWRWFNGERLFGNYFNDDDSKVRFDRDGNLADYPDVLDKPASPLMSWAHDWRCTFLLHAFSPKKPRYGIKDNGITPRYIMERRSNFARAVYPMVRSMYASGLIDDHDLGLS